MFSFGKVLRGEFGILKHKKAFLYLGYHISLPPYKAVFHDTTVKVWLHSFLKKPSCQSGRRASCVLGNRNFSAHAEEVHLAGLRQVAQGPHIPQFVQDGLGHTGCLLQFLDGDILFPVDGGLFQSNGGIFAQAF